MNQHAPLHLVNPDDPAPQNAPVPAPAPPAPALRASCVSVRYHGQLAVRDVELAIPSGQITALIGPSGCGKTSFLSTLNRMTDMIPGCKVSGAVRLDELDVLDASTDVIALRRRVGMIAQKPNPLPMSIRRNLELPLKEHGCRDRADRNQRIEQALQAVGLWDEVKDRLSRSALGLSGGQQQRLCIARAVVLDPQVLLLDEPCSALDPIAAGVVEDHLAQLRGRYTQVIVTHNLGQARRLADAAAMFWVRDGAGVLIEIAPTEQLFDSPTDPITQAYLAGVRG